MPPDPDTTPPATVRAIAVAPELLASVAGAMADGVTVARETATGLRAHRYTHICPCRLCRTCFPDRRNVSKPGNAALLQLRDELRRVEAHHG